MNRMEHQRKADAMNDRAHHYVYGDGNDPVVGHAFAAMAQVHATQALTLATIGDNAAQPGETFVSPDRLTMAIVVVRDGKTLIGVATRSSTADTWPRQTWCEVER